MIINISHLEISLKTTWSAATSYDTRHWSSDNPAYGQCAVTACVVQDYLGGDIVWAWAVLPDGEKVSHFFNRVDGVELDMTRMQFPAGTIIPMGVDHPADMSTRAYILSCPHTMKRYEMLKHDVNISLKGVA